MVQNYIVQYLKKFHKYNQVTVLTAYIELVIIDTSFKNVIDKVCKQTADGF